MTCCLCGMVVDINSVNASRTWTLPLLRVSTRTATNGRMPVSMFAARARTTKSSFVFCCGICLAAATLRSGCLRVGASSCQPAGTTARGSRILSRESAPGRYHAGPWRWTVFAPAPLFPFSLVRGSARAPAFSTRTTLATMHPGSPARREIEAATGFVLGHYHCLLTVFLSCVGLSGDGARALHPRTACSSESCLTTVMAFMPNGGWRK